MTTLQKQIRVICDDCMCYGLMQALGKDVTLGQLSPWEILENIESNGANYDHPCRMHPLADDSPYDSPDVERCDCPCDKDRVYRGYEDEDENGNPWPWTSYPTESALDKEI